MHKNKKEPGREYYNTRPGALPPPQLPSTPDTQVTDIPAESEYEDVGEFVDKHHVNRDLGSYANANVVPPSHYEAPYQCLTVDAGLSRQHWVLTIVQFTLPYNKPRKVLSWRR